MLFFMVDGGCGMVGRAPPALAGQSQPRPRVICRTLAREPAGEHRTASRGRIKESPMQPGESSRPGPRLSHDWKIETTWLL